MPKLRNSKGAIWEAQQRGAFLRDRLPEPEVHPKPMPATVKLGELVLRQWEKLFVLRAAQG